MIGTIKRNGIMMKGEFLFIQGGIDRLKNINNSHVDAVILSNIIDNLYPDDAEILMSEVERVLKENGKVLVKLNPYITTEQITEWNIKIIKDNLLDDGLILWNNTTECFGLLREYNEVPLIDGKTARQILIYMFLR